MKEERVRIIDIADELGLSTATVRILFYQQHLDRLLEYSATFAVSDVYMLFGKTDAYHHTARWEGEG